MAKKKISEKRYKNHPVVLLTCYLTFQRKGDEQLAEVYRRKLAEVGVTVNPEKIEEFTNV